MREPPGARRGSPERPTVVRSFHFAAKDVEMNSLIVIRRKELQP